MTGESGERIWNKWSWMDWECIQEDIPDSEQTMHGHILTWHLSPQMGGLGGGGAGKLSWWIIPCLHFLLLLLFVKWSSACLHQFYSYGSGVSPQWSSELSMWAHCPDGFPHCAWTALSAHSDFVGSRVCAHLHVTCQLHFWQWLGSLKSHCSNMGVQCDKSRRVSNGDTVWWQSTGVVIGRLQVQSPQPWSSILSCAGLWRENLWQLWVLSGGGLPCTPQ